MMTEQEYNDAKQLVNNLEKQIIEINSHILIYENENKPEFTSIKDIRVFIENAKQGALFEFKGNIYEVGDYQYSIEEYGISSTNDFLYSASLKDLLAQRMIYSHKV